MGQHGEAGCRAEDGARKSPRAPVRWSAPDLSWADDDKLDDVDDDADVLQMAASAAAQRRAASAAAQRRGAPSMQSPRRMGESAEDVKNFGQENRQAPTLAGVAPVNQPPHGGVK
ncbi:hypothetical protein M885DRAFT_571374 [Pelagophyceae sp. CCMP2097]|nr:hypothetical protein M885DRAFT_571374 [Pelagophyceae sp. CCMP2097]